MGARSKITIPAAPIIDRSPASLARSHDDFGNPAAARTYGNRRSEMRVLFSSYRAGVWR